MSAMIFILNQMMNIVYFYCGVLLLLKKSQN